MVIPAFECKSVDITGNHYCCNSCLDSLADQIVPESTNKLQVDYDIFALFLCTGFIFTDIFSCPFLYRPEQDQWALKKAVLGVARCLGSRGNCLALGVSLALDQETMAPMNNLPSGHYWEGDAYDMLNRWIRKAPVSPGPALHRALVDIQQKELADEFATVLLAVCKLGELMGRGVLKLREKPTP